MKSGARGASPRIAQRRPRPPPSGGQSDSRLLVLLEMVHVEIANRLEPVLVGLYEPGDGRFVGEDADGTGAALDLADAPTAREAEMIEAQVDEIVTVLVDVGYTCAKVYGGLERRDIDPLIPVALRGIPWRAKIWHGPRRAVFATGLKPRPQMTSARPLARPAGSALLPPALRPRT